MARRIETKATVALSDEQMQRVINREILGPMQARMGVADNCARLQQEGLGIEQIARIIGCCRTTVSNLLSERRNGTAPKIKRGVNHGAHGKCRRASGQQRKRRNTRAR